MNLLEKLYPITNEHNEIVEYKPITKVLELENVPGYVVSLSEKEPSIFVSHQSALKLKDK